MKNMFPLVGRYFTVAVLASSLGIAGAATPKAKVDDTPVDRQSKVTTSFSPIIKKAAPSVVSVYSAKTFQPTRNDRGQSPFGNQNPFGGQLDPSHPLYRFFGPNMPDFEEQFPSRPERGMGSGVIISEDGYILTNNHVVEGADTVEVTFANSTERVSAKVVGTDPATDVAVLKVERKNLPPILIGDNEKLEVGDVVLAIGNPFGVGQTVTMGIVSGLGRDDIGIINNGFGYEDFIQTDASINPGNSGGALVDAEGRLVGINTAIFSRSGGNIGIGFAIPINLARFVADSIISEGKVVRGFLGLLPQPVDLDTARAFGLTQSGGALVAEVNKGTPAEKAGIKRGDIITHFNGKKVNDNRHLRLLASQTKPGTKVDLKLVRDGKEKVVAATLGELPLRMTSRNNVNPGRNNESPVPDLEGLQLSNLNNNLRRQFGLEADIQGALVTRVQPGSKAEEAGLRPGSVIMEVNRKPVANADEAESAISSSKEGKALLYVYIPQRNGEGVHQYLVLDVKGS